MTTLAGVEGKKILVLTSEGFPMQPGREMFAFVDDDRAREGLAERRLVDARGDALRRHEPDPVGRQDRQRQRHHASTPSTPAGLTAATGDVGRERPPDLVIGLAGRHQNTTESMQLMAEMTGGLASMQTNNFGDAFKRIQQRSRLVLLARLPRRHRARRPPALPAGADEEPQGLPRPQPPDVRREVGRSRR